MRLTRQRPAPSADQSNLCALGGCTKYNGFFACRSDQCGLAHLRYPHFERMRIAIVTESFPPDVNGVAHSVVRTAEHLVRRGHRPMVIAPQPAPASSRARAGQPAPDAALPYPVLRVSSVPMPGYPQFRLGLPGRELAAALRAHDTELVHLASPFVLGARGVAVARALGLPS